MSYNSVGWRTLYRSEVAAWSTLSHLVKLRYFFRTLLLIYAVFSAHSKNHAVFMTHWATKQMYNEGTSYNCVERRTLYRSEVAAWSTLSHLVKLRCFFHTPVKFCAVFSAHSKNDVVFLTHYLTTRNCTTRICESAPRLRCVFQISVPNSNEEEVHWNTSWVSAVSITNLIRLPAIEVVERPCLCQMHRMQRWEIDTIGEDLVFDLKYCPPPWS